MNGLKRLQQAAMNDTDQRRKDRDTPCAYAATRGLILVVACDFLALLNLLNL